MLYATKKLSISVEKEISERIEILLGREMVIMSRYSGSLGLMLECQSSVVLEKG